MYTIKYKKYKKKYLALKSNKDIFSKQIIQSCFENLLNCLSNDLSDRELIELKKNDLIQLLNCLSNVLSVEYPIFLDEWLKFKEIADKQLNPNKQNNQLNPNEYNIAKKKIIHHWLDIIKRCLTKKSINNHDIINTYVQNHISSIIKLGYNLDNRAIKILQKVFLRFLLYDQIPAPFSIISILRNKSTQSTQLAQSAQSTQTAESFNYPISVSVHCLLMANYWLYNPPISLNKNELDELIVLSLFHDLYYYDDFINHDIRILNLFEPYIKSDIIKKIIGTHVDLVPFDISTNNFNQLGKSDQFNKLTYEWTQIDWYYSLSIKNNMKLSIKDFYHHIGNLMTR
jgi:hypothetical protein